MWSSSSRVVVRGVHALVVLCGVVLACRVVRGWVHTRSHTITSGVHRGTHQYHPSPCIPYEGVWGGPYHGGEGRPLYHGVGCGMGPSTYGVSGVHEELYSGYARVIT